MSTNELFKCDDVKELILLGIKLENVLIGKCFKSGKIATLCTNIKQEHVDSYEILMRVCKSLSRPKYQT